MTKEEAIEELESLLYYWTQIKFYDNKREQEAVQYAIDYLNGNEYYGE